MKFKSLCAALLLSISSFALASEKCTSEPQEKWMKVTEFKSKIEEKGYKVRSIKQSRSCFEVYGQNPQGEQIEAYFNPITGELVKSEQED